MTNGAIDRNVQRPSRKGVGPSGPKRAAPKRVMIWSDLYGNMQEPAMAGGSVASSVEHNDGVTDRGIRMQLVDDGMVETNGDVKQGQAAEYLKDCIVEALDTTIKAARDIMAWLQEVAKRLADAGLPFDWITPTGSMVRQAYRVKTVERIRTMVGQLALDREVSHLLTVKKQALGAAPNFIHSFDAAHLSLTVSYACAQGMQDFSMIHDSFGTHAGNTDALAAILRRAFVDIYEVDWIERTREYVAGYAPHVELPEAPLRGDFDIAEVIEATFFFS